MAVAAARAEMQAAQVQVAVVARAVREATAVKTLILKIASPAEATALSAGTAVHRVLVQSE